MSSLEQSRTKLAGEADLVQKKAFTKWINSHLAKVGIEIKDLFQDLRDGSVLLTLLEIFTGKKMPKEKGTMKVHKIQNVKYAINYLTDVRKIRIVGIPNEEIVDGNRKLTLGLVWMLILNFELSGALPSEPGERSVSPKEVSAKEIKKELLEWAKAATEGYEEVSVTNFHTSWRDGLAFSAIINRHRPDLLDYDEECHPDTPLVNLEKSFSVAQKELNVIRLLDPEDVNVEKPSEEAILMYVSALRQVFPDMPPPHRKKGPPVSLEEYSCKYDMLREWVEQRRTLVGNRDFPSSVDGVKRLLDDFVKMRENEDAMKEKELMELKEMAGELKIFALKRRKEMDIPPIEDIEEIWSSAMNESDQYLSALQDELSRLLKRDELINNITSLIDSASSSLNNLEKEMTQFETESISMATDEVSIKANEIKNKLNAVVQIVDDIKTKLSVLSDGYSDGIILTLQSQVSSLDERIQSLQSQLDRFLSSVDDAQLLLSEADSKLKDCEKWLISHGKFAENQLIIDQVAEYQAFQANELRLAGQIMERVNSSPLPGMEDQTEQLNARWSLIQDQINNRIPNLTAISQTVTQFDSIKGPLQDWITSQHQLISSLPLLDTDLTLLAQQRQTFESILSDLMSHEKNITKIQELSDKFNRDREPVQSSADKFARKLKRLSQEYSVQIQGMSTNDDDEASDISLYEQSGILRDEWKRFCNQIKMRLQQADELKNKLAEFEALLSVLRLLVKEGWSLLHEEQPVGDSAERISQQTITCQTFRQKLTDHQPQVDQMLAMGRSIISQHYTAINNSSTSGMLTEFIQEWSNLLLQWQGWYDNLHVQGEESQNMSDRLDHLERTMRHVMPLYEDMFPAALQMKNIVSDLIELQDSFNKSVYAPLVELKAALPALPSSHVLSGISETLREFNEFMDKVQSTSVELHEVVESVTCWFPEFKTVSSKISERREELTEARPLGGSLPIINKQDEEIQSQLLQVEESRPKYQRCLRNLTSLGGHVTILSPDPINRCKEDMQKRWEELYEQVEKRRDLVEIGRVRLNVYLECRDPFDVWLRSAEGKLSLWKRVDTGGKDALLKETELLQAFKADVELHQHDLSSMSNYSEKFNDIAKEHQDYLLDYRNKLHPDRTLSRILPEGFYDWEVGGASLMTSSADHGDNPFASTTYVNGLQAVSQDISYQKKKYQQLRARVLRRVMRYEEAREKRLACEEAMEAILPKLEGAESLIQAIKGAGLGKNSLKSLREQLEMMESLEGEFAVLRSLMDPLHMSVAAWTVREPTDSEGEEEVGGASNDEGGVVDECVREKEKVQERYESVQENLRLLRTELESSLAEAQAFQSAYSSFASWLRDTERKIQRDNQLKLEINDLRSGLGYLKAVSSDISSHEDAYSDLCGRFTAVLDIMAGGELEDNREKLENLQTRWAGLQVIHEDIEVISSIIPQLESFYTNQRQLLLLVNELHEKLTLYSPSTTTNEGAELKKEELQVLIDEYNSLQVKFDELLSDSSNLIETPFDQRKFQQDIDGVREKLDKCKAVKDEKNKSLKHITNRIKTIEVKWVEFDTWLTSNEELIESLMESVNRSGANTSEQLKQSQQLEEDITEYESQFDAIESLISSLSNYLETSHSKYFEARLKGLNMRYKMLAFNAQAYPLEAWLQSRFCELYSMRKTAVLVLPLTTQIREIGRFQHQVEIYQPRLLELEGVVSSLPDQSDLSAAKIKMEFVLKEYQTLVDYAGRRGNMLGSFLPRVKLYQGSLENWETLLTKWEESSAALVPPTATPNLIQTQLEMIKSYQLDISNHEPEFLSLMRESLIIYSGPEGETLLMDNLRGVAVSASPLPPDDTRQGQSELQCRLDDDKVRLENLKKLLADKLSHLLCLHDNIAKFNAASGQLLPWLQDQAQPVQELSIHHPRYEVLQKQLTKCQSLQGLLSNKSPLKDDMSHIYQDIASALPSDDPHLPALKTQLDHAHELWTHLSTKLSSALSSLSPASKLARSYEKETVKLSNWLSKTLGDLSESGTTPSLPSDVQDMKIKIDTLKSEYHGLAPFLVQCVEEGAELATFVDDSEEKEKLLANVRDLQSKWDNVGGMLTDIHQRLTEALMQTQEFQQVADSLERWINATMNSLKSLELPGARVRVIEPQIEGFKSILDDISSNRGTLEQSKAIGLRVAADASVEEKMKIEKRLHALETRFYGLEKVGKGRMTELKEALEKAETYERRCGELDKWLKMMEDKWTSWPATPIRSQPLKPLLDDATEYHNLVLCQVSVVQEMTAGEVALFGVDLSVIQTYETEENLHLIIDSASPHHRTLVGDSAHRNRSSTITSSTTPPLPEFIRRPGSVEAIETGAKLRDRFGKLRLMSSSNQSMTSQCLDNVTVYESTFGSFNDWLGGAVARLQEVGPPSLHSDVIKAQIQKIEGMQLEVQSKQLTLESINTTGTSLVDGCHDELSRDSVRESLSEVNERWGDLLDQLERRNEKLKEVLKYAEKYEMKEKELEVWLDGCEQKMNKSIDRLDEMLKYVKDVQSELSSKRLLLDTTVSLGQSLESQYDATDIISSSHPLSYPTHIKRYTDLVLQLGETERQLQSSLAQAGSIKSDVDSLCDQLLGLKTSLENHPPPRLSTDLIKEQIRELENVSHKWSSLQPSVSDLLSKADALKSHDVTMATSNLTQINNDVKTLLDQWNQRLNGVMASIDVFESEYAGFNQWLGEVHGRMSDSSVVHATVDGVNRQIEDINSINSDISHHQESLKQLMKLGRDLMGGASPEDCVLIGDRLAQVQASYESLQRHSFGRLRSLNDELHNAQQFYNIYHSLLSKLTSHINDLSLMPPVGTDIDTVQNQLVEFKEFEDDIQSLKASILQCVSKGNYLKESCTPLDHSWLDECLNNINTSWSSLQAGCFNRQQLLENALLRLGQFHEALQELIGWITDSTNSLTAGGDTFAVVLDPLERQMNELKTLQSDIVTREPSVNSLNEAAGKLLASNNDEENTAEIQNDIDKLNTDWDALKDLTSDKHLKLSAALERTRGFHSNKKSITDRLIQLEDSTTLEWKPHGLPETCQRDIDEHKVFMSEVESLKGPVEELRLESEGLKVQADEEDQVVIDGWIGDLEGRVEEVMIGGEEREAQLNEAKSAADDFDDRYTDLSNRLNELTKQSKDFVIHSEVEAVNKQLENHNVFLESLQQLSNEIESLSASGGHIMKTCHSDDSLVIKDKLTTLKASYDSLQTTSLDQYSQLEEALLTLGQFEQAYSDLKEWMVRIWESLNNCDPIPGHSDTISGLGVKNKNIQKELNVRTNNYKSVMKAGRELMKSKGGDDRNILKRKLADMEQEWQGVCQLCQNRQVKLEDALKKVRQFESLVHPFKSWMTKVIPTLDQSDPVHGDIATVHELITSHETFQNELGSHQKNMNAIISSAQSLSNEVLDDPSIISETIKEPEQLWKDVCPLSIKKQERLKQAEKVVLEFGQEVRKMWGWMDNKIAELDVMSPPADELEQLNYQIQEQELFQEEMATHQPNMDALNKTTK
jgi:DNA repair exonuclease SbcCD ATPase subunit